MALLRRLFNKNCPKLELFILVFALYNLWFSSSDDYYLELNVKLVACSVRFFIYVMRYWKNQMMFISLLVGNCFVIIVPSSNLPVIPTSLQTALLCVLFQFLSRLLHVRLYEVLLSKVKHEGKLFSFVVGNTHTFSILPA
jgi:hypothetical protein